MHVHGIHHVTAITAEVAINHRFYTDTLGLRLVKKSVNQDDVSAYHMFYADADATPGSDITFFDWPNAGYTAPGSALATMVTFRAPRSGPLCGRAKRRSDGSRRHPVLRSRRSSA